MNREDQVRAFYEIRKMIYLGKTSVETNRVGSIEQNIVKFKNQECYFELRLRVWKVDGSHVCENIEIRRDFSERIQILEKDEYLYSGIRKLIISQVKGKTLSINKRALNDSENRLKEILFIKD